MMNSILSRKRLSFVLAVLLVASVIVVSPLEGTVSAVNADSGASVKGAGGTLATYTFTSPGWATFGIVLPRGKAFAGLEVGSLTTQNDVKNRWPDGSIRYAILTVRVASTGDYPITERMPATGSFMPTIPNAELSLKIEGLATEEYKSTLPGDMGADLWLDGPLVKEYRVRSIPEKDGDEHPFLSNIWDVRIYNDGTGTVDATVENVRDVAEAQGVVYAVDISVNGQNVFHRDALKPGPNPIYSTADPTVYTSVDNGVKKGNYIRLKSGEIGVADTTSTDDKIRLYPMHPAAAQVNGEPWEIVRFHQYGARWHKTFPISGFTHATVKTDFSPFIAAKAIPEYIPTVSNDSYVDTINDGEWEVSDILHFSIMVTYLGMSGGRAEIGPYPDWAARYLVHDTPQLKALTLNLGDLSGSFAAHFAKDDPSKIVTLDEKPNYWLDGREGPGNKPLNNMKGAGVLFENSHAPSLAYIPYLVTGTRYYSDEMLHHANFAVLSIRGWTGTPRNGVDGLIWQDQMRGFAWGLRDITDAAMYLPDQSSYKAYFAHIMNANLSAVDDHVLQIDSPLGFVGFGGNSDDGFVTAAPWQYAYLAWSFDHAITQNGNNEAGRTARRHLLKSLLDPLSGVPGFPVEYAAGYWIKVGLGTNSTNAQFFRTWKEVFDTNYRNADGSLNSAGNLTGSYWLEMRMAMILAKKSSMPGADKAYDLLMNVDEENGGSLTRYLNDRSAFAIADWNDVANTEASIGNIAGVGVGDSMSGIGTMTDPYRVAISVPNSKAILTLADIEASTNAAVTLCTDAGFAVSVSAISLAAGQTTTVYIKIVSEDGQNERYYAVAVTRASDGGETSPGGLTPPGGDGSSGDGPDDLNVGERSIQVTVGADGIPVLSTEPTAANPLDLAQLPASALKIANKTWTGKRIKYVLSVNLTYRLNGKTVTKTLKFRADYTTSKPGKNKNIGKGNVTIKGLAGSKYKGSKALTFKIVPKKPTDLKLTTGKKSLAIKWKKVSKAQKVTGYQVQYRYKSGAKWSKWKTKSFRVSYKAKAKTITKTIKKLKAKKSYQVRIRTCKTIKSGASKGKYYSAWRNMERS